MEFEEFRSTRSPEQGSVERTRAAIPKQILKTYIEESLESLGISVKNSFWKTKSRKRPFQRDPWKDFLKISKQNSLRISWKSLKNAPKKPLKKSSKELQKKLL